MSTPRPARPLLTRVQRGLRTYAVCSPLTARPDRERLSAQLAARR